MGSLPLGGYGGTEEALGYLGSGSDKGVGGRIYMRRWEDFLRAGPGDCKDSAWNLQVFERLLCLCKMGWWRSRARLVLAHKGRSCDGSIRHGRNQDRKTSSFMK